MRIGIKGETNPPRQTPHTMDKFKEVEGIIDSVIGSGFMTSVDVYRVLGHDPDAKSYILKHHLDEELEAYLGM